MDLITTGVSASERGRRANLVAALRELIADKLSPGSSPGLKMNHVIDFPKLIPTDLLMIIIAEMLVVRLFWNMFQIEKVSSLNVI